MVVSLCLKFIELLTILAFANIGIYRMAQKKRTQKKTDSGEKEKNIFNRPIVKLGKVSLAVWQIVAAIIVLVIAFILINKSLTKEENSSVKYYHFKKEGELTFVDSTGNPIIKIDIEIADNDYERQLGLMNRESMEEMQGMLFIFPEEKYQSFWMFNTLFSLDMLFINSNKEIVTIHKNTKPLSEQSYPSSKPALYVLEVNAGFCDRHNIKLGGKVFWMETKLSNSNQ
jgi:uncharacterized membrane protein (UPF0127 family)